MLYFVLFYDIDLLFATFFVRSLRQSFSTRLSEMMRWVGLIGLLSIAYVIGEVQKGVIPLDPVTFNQIVDGSRNVLVKFDTVSLLNCLL